MIKEAERIIDEHSECKLNTVAAPQNAPQNNCSQQAPSNAIVQFK